MYRTFTYAAVNAKLVQVLLTVRIACNEKKRYIINNNNNNSSSNSSSSRRLKGGAEGRS